MRKIDNCVHCKNCQGSLCINNIPLLSGLNEEEMKAISNGIAFHDYEKGESIFKSGDNADKLYIVCSGQMKIYTYLPDGKEQLLYIYSSGDFVGALNLLKKDRYKYNAIALEKTTISTLSKEKFNEIAIKNPNILLKILEKSYERIRWAESLIDRLSSGSADAKTARLLINLAKDFGKKTDRGIVLELAINREEMGSYAGLSRETVTRKLNQYKDMGYVEFKGNKTILIKDMESLERFLDK